MSSIRQGKDFESDESSDENIKPDDVAQTIKALPSAKQLIPQQEKQDNDHDISLNNSNIQTEGQIMNYP